MAETFPILDGQGRIKREGGAILSHRDITYVILAAAILFMVYRRGVAATAFRTLTSRGLVMRSLLYVAIAVLIVAGTLSHPLDSIYDALGLVAGAAVALLAIRTSTFTQAGDAWRYRPHPWIGMGLFVFFVARIAYDFMAHPAPTLTRAPASPANLASLSADPLSSALLLVIVAYYLVYNVFLMRHARSLGV